MSSAFPLLADHTKKGFFCQHRRSSDLHLKKGLREQLSQWSEPLSYQTFSCNIRSQKSEFASLEDPITGARADIVLTDTAFKPSMLLTDIYNSLLLYRTSGETSGDWQVSTCLSFDSIPQNMGLCRLCRLEKSGMGRMERIHGLSHSLRSHDEARERRNGVSNQRVLKKFYKNAKASFLHIKWNGHGGKLHCDPMIRERESNLMKSNRGTCILKLHITWFMPCVETDLGNDSHGL